MKTANGASSRKRLGSRLGAATVEFAFLAPLLLVVVLGIWELGRMVEVQQIISNAAREGGRQASTGNLTNEQVKAVVRNYMTQAGLSSAAANNATVNVTNKTTSSLDATQANQLDHFQITVSVNYSDVRWTTLNLIANSSTTLNGSADWYSDNDAPLSVSTSIPLQ